MPILLATLVMMFFVGVGVLKALQTDPANTQNIATTTANAIAENAFYYINVAMQYVNDNNPTLPATGVLSIDQADYSKPETSSILDSYLLDSINFNANYVFLPLNDRNSYVVLVDSKNYLLATWNGVSNRSDDSSAHYRPSGVTTYSYDIVSHGIMGTLTSLINGQSAVNRNPYIFGYFNEVDKYGIPTPCNGTNFNNMSNQDKGMVSIIINNLCSYQTKKLINIKQYVILEQISDS